MNTRQIAADALMEIVDADASMIEVPPDPSLGDLALPCFHLSKSLRKSPAEIATDLVKRLKPKRLIGRIECRGAYLNFFLNRPEFARAVLSEINAGGKDYGLQKKHGKRVMIEFSQVNTHKAFHVGHLRGTLLGACLVNMYRFLGHDTVAANYQGDIGAHVAKVIWYMEKHRPRAPKTGKGRWLGEIYQRASKEALDHAEEVATVLRRIEQGDQELVKLWKQTRQWSLDDFEIFYKRLGISFDHLFFESEFEDEGKRMVRQMLKQGKAKMSDGAVVIGLEAFGLGTFLLLKRDGTALYSTKDLALAVEKFRKFHVHTSMYVVGAEQKLYFHQLFKTLEIIGFSQAERCKHIPYGLVNLKGGKISSREGELIYAEELVDEVTALAAHAVTSRHKLGAKAIQERSSIIALAAVKFSFLNQDNSKEIVFDKDRALAFEGETGPYVQYTYARIASILAKAKTRKFPPGVWTGITEQEFLIARMLAEYPDTVRQAAEHCRPLIITRYLLDLCQLFNTYYHSTPVLKAKPELLHWRLELLECINHVLKSALGLLGIDALEKM